MGLKEELIKFRTKITGNTEEVSMITPYIPNFFVFPLQISVICCIIPLKEPKLAYFIVQRVCKLSKS